MTPQVARARDDVAGHAKGQASYATDLAAYGHDLRAFLKDHRPLDAWRGRGHVSTEERICDDARLLAALYSAGWSRYGWPEGVGGLGGDERHRGVLYDELSRAGLPVPEPMLLFEVLGPPLIRFAPELAAHHIPDYLAGREWWGQGFSEPEAGSDLASLRCRARRDGDDYVLTGQKLWTSHGATATRLVCLVRTGTPESRHRGLTMMLVDADSPGLTIRPIALASGDRELAEVFFDEVRVPATNLIGAEGQGWAVAMYLLQFERAMYAWQSATVALRRLGELRDTITARSKPPAGDAAARIGRCYLDIVSLRARSGGTIRRLAAGETVGPEASVDKILLAAVEQGINDLARDLLDAQFLLDSDPATKGWRADWWYSRAATIMGGSSEVQRTIIADHVLALPKETAR